MYSADFKRSQFYIPTYFKNNALFFTVRYSCKYMRSIVKTRRNPNKLFHIQAAWLSEKKIYVPSLAQLLT